MDLQSLSVIVQNGGSTAVLGYVLILFVRRITTALDAFGRISTALDTMNSRISNVEATQKTILERLAQGVK
jgi:hypothetical protein